MKEQIKDNRLKKIILRAENIFFEKGFARTSISDICKAANCSRTTLYSHFENKENIYLAVINNSYKSFLNYFINLKIEEENGLNKLLRYAEGYIDYSKQYPKNYLMILDFYGLLKSTNNEDLQSDSDILLSKCSFFPEVKKNAEIPSVFLVKIIEKGQEDGSINASISANVLFLNFWAYLIGCSNLFNFFPSTKNVNILGLEMKSPGKDLLNFIRKIMS